VAEANQGGEMVRGLLAQAQAPCAVTLVHARYSKRVRAEPVAALYERGLVTHCGAFPALEEEMMALGCDDGGPSPDRADALVWALTDLLLGRVAKPAAGAGVVGWGACAQCCAQS
jgi:phage terminase large subunit-like protein